MGGWNWERIKKFPSRTQKGWQHPTTLHKALANPLGAHTDGPPPPEFSLAILNRGRLQTKRPPIPQGGHPTFFGSF